MKKILAILTVLTLGLAPVSFAATVLTDSQMDQVSAGDWVVLTDSSGNQTVEDVYYNNNTIDLFNESQKDLKAVSNANAVDSAVAVQTNISSVTGGTPINNVGVNGSNTATIYNYNPSKSKSSDEAKLHSESESFALAKGESSYFTLNKNESSSSSFGLSETYDEVETLDILASASSSSATSCKSCHSASASAAAFLLDYDKNIDFDKFIQKSSSSSKTLNIAKYEAEFTYINKSETETSSSEKHSSSRKNLSENNHLNLADNSQQNIQVVSNLNAVGSGAAIQTNIASDVGVSGTITHVNVATVVNGL